MKSRRRDVKAATKRSSAMPATDAPSLQLRKRKKSMSELVNEQMSGRASGADYDPFLGEDDTMGIAEDYEWGGAPDHDNDHSDTDGKKSRKRARSADTNGGGGSARTAAASGKRLRLRGSLDPSLTEGKYAARPVADVEAVMDNIFGDLDMGDLDAEGEEVFSGPSAGDAGGDDDSAGADEEDHDEGARGRRRPTAKKAKDLTEEEYAAFLESKRKRRRAALAGSGLGMAAVGGEEGAILEQLESLRQAQLKLFAGEHDGDKDDDGDAAAAAQRRKSEAATRERTQEAVRHYIMLYAQLLRVRVRLQPVVTKAISLPQHYARPMFLQSAKSDTAGSGECVTDPAEIAAAYEEVSTQLRELLAGLYRLTPAGSKGAAALGRSAPQSLPTLSFAQLHKFHESHVRKHANTCLEYWGSKLVQTNSAKLKTIAQPLPQQIEAILANMPRLRAKVQKNRAHLRIIGHPDHELAAAASASPSSASANARASEAALRRATALAEGDHDGEIYDDADFLRELVRRGGTVAHRLEQQLAELNRETLPAQQANRKGFHKLTKGKEVNYEPRPKLVGFLMSEGFDNSERNDVVLRSLFQ